MKKSFKAFTLVELLVSLAVIAIAVTSALTVMVFSRHSLVRDKDLQLSVDFSNNYFSRCYVGENLKKCLFSDNESAELDRTATFPHMMEPLITNLNENVRAVINRKISRWSPLLVNIGIEIIVTDAKRSESGKPVKRNFWFETTLSEAVLKRMI